MSTRRRVQGRASLSWTCTFFLAGTMDPKPYDSGAGSGQTADGSWVTWHYDSFPHSPTHPWPASLTDCAHFSTELSCGLRIVLNTTSGDSFNLLHAALCGSPRDCPETTPMPPPPPEATRCALLTPTALYLPGKPYTQLKKKKEKCLAITLTIWPALASRIQGKWSCDFGVHLERLRTKRKETGTLSSSATGNRLWRCLEFFRGLSLPRASIALLKEGSQV